MMRKYILVATVFLLLLSSCRYKHRNHVSGHGPTVTEQRNLTGFTGVQTTGDLDIYVSQGAFAVKVVCDQSLLPYIETSVENGQLHARFKPGMSIGDYHDAKVYVTAPQLNNFETHGSGDIKGEGKISDKNKIDIAVSGSGDVALQLDCPVIKTETFGSGDISLEGQARNVYTETTGSGDVNIAKLKSETVKITVRGSGDAEVYASESLDAEIFGSGDVHYKGEPKIVSSIHGSGELSKMD